MTIAIAGHEKVRAASGEAWCGGCSFEEKSRYHNI
jgi:hypothetical protein